MTFDLEHEIRRSAEFSLDQRYRYSLSRTWGRGRRIAWIMLNPSTADASVDDPTIRRCMGFARAWGACGIVVANLFALRSTDPRALREAPDPVGAHNDRAIVEIAEKHRTVICAWGQHGKLHGRDHAVLELLRTAGCRPMALAFAKDGTPKHPLYLRGDLRPAPFEKTPSHRGSTDV